MAAEETTTLARQTRHSRSTQLGDDLTHTLTFVRRLQEPFPGLPPDSIHSRFLDQYMKRGGNLEVYKPQVFPAALYGTVRYLGMLQTQCVVNLHYIITHITSGVVAVVRFVAVPDSPSNKRITPEL